MLDDVARDHEIETAEMFQIAIDQRLDELHAGIRAPRDFDPTLRSIDTRNFISERRESSGYMTVAATEIADRFHAIETLHELDEHVRQLLARCAVAGAFGFPLKLAIRRRRHLLIPADKVGPGSS